MRDIAEQRAAHADCDLVNTLYHDNSRYDGAWYC